MSKIKTVFLDLDGVIVDFHGPSFARNGISPDAYPWPGRWDYVDLLGLDPVKYWEGFDDAEFWATLPWTREGKLILAALEARFDPANICLLSSAGWMPFAAAGKLQWVKREMPDYATRAALTSAKHFMARPDAVLIDDGDHNVNAFRQAGGHAVLIPRPWNSNHREELGAVEYLRQALTL